MEQLYLHETDLHSPTGPQLIIQSKKDTSLQLRLVTANDAEALLRLFTDPQNVQYDESCAGLDNQAAIDALIEQWRTFTQPLKRVNLVIVIDGKVVGTSGLGWIGIHSDGKKTGDAGVMLDPDSRGKGYAYEALRIAIDYGFTVLGLEEVDIATRDANDAMKGLMNAKFRFEASPTNDGFGNEWIWRITREDWFRSTHSN